MRSMSPNPDSPRLASIVRHGEELLRISRDAGANGIALCGSVARGDDGDSSDIDFYVHAFCEPESPDGRDRAERLVKRFRGVLLPYEVDIRGIPGWFIDPPQEASMKLDSIDLASVIADFTSA